MEFALSFNLIHWAFGVGVHKASRRVVCVTHGTVHTQTGTVVYLRILCFCARLTVPDYDISGDCRDL